MWSTPRPQRNSTGIHFAGGLVGQGRWLWKICPPKKVRKQIIPVNSELLYWLCYPGHILWLVHGQKYNLSIWHSKPYPIRNFYSENNLETWINYKEEWESVGSEHLFAQRFWNTFWRNGRIFVRYEIMVSTINGTCGKSVRRKLNCTKFYLEWTHWTASNVAIEAKNN